MASEKKSKSAKKASMHPNLRLINVVSTKGDTYQVLSTLGNDTIKLDVDPFTHVAWRDENSGIMVSKSDAATSFNNRFGGLGSLIERKQ